MGEFITPPTLPPTTYCRRLLIPNTPEWIGTVTGALMDLIYETSWKKTTGISAEDAANRARVMFNEYLNSGNDGECGDMACCGDVQIIYRVNPETGMIEQSNNNGGTWSPANNTLQSSIVEPIPSITSGVSASKCDSATNIKLQVDAWVAQVTEDFDTATSLLAFAEAVLIAIVAAVFLVISAGALGPIEALVLPTIGAACAAAFLAGKAAFVAYWTAENTKKVLCAALDTIGDDGAFTQAQFDAFWAMVNTDLPPSPAKMLFMAFLSSVGKQGVNSMAASGVSSSATCDCVTGDCSSGFYIDQGTLVSNDGVHVIITAVNYSGTYIASVARSDFGICCTYLGNSIGSGGVDMSQVYTTCDDVSHTGFIASGAQVYYLAFRSTVPFTIDIEFGSI
jgi:hypothetical protein